MTIYKYKLNYGFTDLGLPSNHRILSVGLDPHDTLCLWAMVDKDAPTVNEIFTVYGTGHELDASPGKFLGTVREGDYMWHVFHHSAPTL